MVPSSVDAVLKSLHAADFCHVASLKAFCDAWHDGTIGVCKLPLAQMALRFSS